MEKSHSQIIHWHFFSPFIGIIFLSIFTLLPIEHWFDSSINLQSRLHLPSWELWLGTDDLGRNVFIRCCLAFQSIVIPIWLGSSIAFAVGIASSILMSDLRDKKKFTYFLQIVDIILTVISSIPAIIFCFFISILLAIVTNAGVMVPLFIIAFARGYYELTFLYRRDYLLCYWQAHQINGGSLLRRIWEYGLKNAWRHELTNQWMRMLQAALIIEVGLSYLGFGIPEPQPSFGNMLAGHYSLLFKGQFHPISSIIVCLVLALFIPQILAYFSLPHFKKS